MEGAYVLIVAAVLFAPIVVWNLRDSMEIIRIRDSMSDIAYHSMQVGWVRRSAGRYYAALVLCVAIIGLVERPEIRVTLLGVVGLALAAPVVYLAMHMSRSMIFPSRTTGLSDDSPGGGETPE